MVSFGRQICSDFNSAISREWLETNGLGSYGFSTLCMASTRRSHGLLVSALDPPGNKFVLLNKMDEKISGPGWSHSISCQEYPDAVSPKGYEYLEQFSLDPFPTFTYLVEDARIRKTFFLIFGENTTVIIYELLSGSPIQIEVKPLVSIRSCDALSQKDERFDNALTHTENGIALLPKDLPGLSMQSSSGFFQKSPCWYFNLQYSHDANEGTEDLFSPGIFRFSLWQGKKVAVVASADAINTIVPDKLYHKELFIRRKISENVSVKGEFARNLVQAGDQFVISGPDSTVITRGYPGQKESIQEMLMAVPGLCMVNGRFPEAKEILIHCIERIQEQHDQICVHAALWLFWAIQKYIEHSDDIAFARLIYKHLMAIYMDIRHGEPSHFLMDDDGLIGLRQPDSEEYIKPCDVQALWYNALQFMEELEIKLGGKRKRYKDLALRVRDSFNAQYWNEQSSYLYNALKKGEHDSAIKPDALLSISLPYPVLDQKRFETIFTTAWKKLYTSFGLRSGSVVKPFWMGAFLTAYFKVFGHQAQNKIQAWQFLSPFCLQMSEGLLGSISESYTNEHIPSGSLAYALSVAEMQRVLIEEIGSQPEHKDLNITEIIK